MEWNKLLSTKRVGQTSDGSENSPPPRTEFTRDYDRIVFSSAFRRLQDKTQVFPLAKSDYVRTRLTHSLEVASVGRSLGMLAAEAITKRNSDLKDLVNPHDIGTIVSTACLAHDIGNPPFGHAGESAIQEWFESASHLADTGITGTHRQDLLKFEGNAQGFRTLCTLQQHPQRGGLQLTSAVLGAFTKYPRASLVDPDQARGISGKKFGFMQSEADIFEELAETLGLLRKSGSALAWHRHPFAFLVEAADDICYHVMDVEDGFKAGCITFEEIEALHAPWLESSQRDRSLKIENKGRRVEYFRAVTVNKMVREAVGVFDLNLDRLMTGSFDDELSARMARADQFKAFKDLAKKKVYSSRTVIEIEACGFEVIAGLLTSFSKAIEVKARDLTLGQIHARTLRGLLPDSESISTSSDPYARTLIATDFVAGMTDSFAVELYQRIRGIALP